MEARGYLHEQQQKDFENFYQDGLLVHEQIQPI